MDDSADIYVPLLSGKMTAETKDQHDVHTSSAVSPVSDTASISNEFPEKKAPWWSYFWVSQSYQRHWSVEAVTDRTHRTTSPTGPTRRGSSSRS